MDLRILAVEADLHNRIEAVEHRSLLGVDSRGAADLDLDRRTWSEI